MEEASLDHGLDRLPIFFLLFLLIAPFSAYATTFGPISVSNQVQNAQYVVRGRIVGSSWVMEDRASRRPYTHWKLQVIEQPKGTQLGSEIVIRQPGGELGGLGYHVAGSAQFRGGEEVFVNLKDTDEAGIKEVIALASGKYTVERGPDGVPLLRSGLGFVLRDELGRAFTPESFVSLVARIEEGKESEEDRNVFVTKGITHDHDPVLEARAHEARHLKSSDSPPPSPPLEFPEDSSVQESLESTEEPKGSSVGWWMLFIAIGLALMAGLALLLKR
jgi:hypothetical protein